MSNNIRIKRRLPNSPLGNSLPSLSSGELAFNEINRTLYYGASSYSVGISAIPIGGDGAFTTYTYTHTNFLPLTGGTITGYISATQDYFSGSNKSVFTPKTNTIGVSAVSNIVVVSVLPVTPDPSTLYIII